MEAKPAVTTVEPMVAEARAAVALVVAVVMVVPMAVEMVGVASAARVAAA